MPHRIFIIDSVIDTEIGPKYFGYLLSSKVEKANIYDMYPQNILIKNYGSIIKSGTGPKINKDAIIKLDKKYELDNDDFEESSVLKGRATEDFKKFINIELQKIAENKSTENDYWNNGVAIIEN